MKRLGLTLVAAHLQQGINRQLQDGKVTST